MSERKRGRPPLSETEASTAVHVAMPISLFDRVYSEATKEHVTVPEIIRRAVEAELEQK